MGAIGDDLPNLREGESRDYAVTDHRLRVTATRELGCNTGYRRYRVECLTCEEVVHEATTGARWNMETHVRRAASVVFPTASVVFPTAGGEGVSGPSDRTLVWHHLAEARRHLRAAVGLVSALESVEVLAELVSCAAEATDRARVALERGESDAG